MSKISRRSVLAGAAAAGATGLIARPAIGQAQWPNRPVTLVCPWGAGGGTDATARIVASLLEKNMGQPFNVVNRTGGSGVVGHSAIATAAPDGYTIGMITVEITMMHHQGLTDLGPTSYTPLALMNEDPPGVQVSASSPYKDIKALAEAISSPPRQWTPEKLWRAYETLEKSKVRGASSARLLTDVVSLVRFALHQEDELAPHAERVRERYENWMAQQANKGRSFTTEQKRWLEMMRDHIGTSLEVEIDDFDLMPFTSEGGLAKATKVFGKDLAAVVREINEALVA